MDLYHPLSKGESIAIEDLHYIWINKICNGVGVANEAQQCTEL